MTLTFGQKSPSPKLLSLPNIQETGIEIVYKGVINTTDDWNDWKFIERCNRAELFVNSLLPGILASIY